jgi:hypothetical protein
MVADKGQRGYCKKELLASFHLVCEAWVSPCRPQWSLAHLEQGDPGIPAHGDNTCFAFAGRIVTDFAEPLLGTAHAKARTQLINSEKLVLTQNSALILTNDT